MSNHQLLLLCQWNDILPTIIVINCNKIDANKNNQQGDDHFSQGRASQYLCWCCWLVLLSYSTYAWNHRDEDLAWLSFINSLPQLYQLKKPKVHYSKRLLLIYMYSFINQIPISFHCEHVNRHATNSSSIVNHDPQWWPPHILEPYHAQYSIIKQFICFINDLPSCISFLSFFFSLLILIDDHSPSIYPYIHIIPTFNSISVQLPQCHTKYQLPKCK